MAMCSGARVATACGLTGASCFASASRRWWDRQAIGPLPTGVVEEPWSGRASRRQIIPSRQNDAVNPVPVNRY